MASQPQSQSQRVRRGEILEDLLGSNRSALMRQARSHSKRAEDADDALSEACVQFLRSYDGPAGRDALRWMLAVLKRCAWDMSRGSRSRVAIAPGGGGDVAPNIRDGRSGPAELVERSEELARISELIEGLKPAERDALLLLGLGYSYKEIAEIRGWSVTKVNRCVTEGRATVRKSLERGVKS
jgi:RNA polymerase sigma factor (sigma-70 family)